MSAPLAGTQREKSIRAHQKVRPEDLRPWCHGTTLSGKPCHARQLKDGLGWCRRHSYLNAGHEANATDKLPPFDPMGSILEFQRAYLPEFNAPSWRGWRQFLSTIGPQTREIYAAVGRGAGKSRIAALLACYFGTRTYARVSGESIYIGIFAPDLKQSGITLRYIIGMMRSHKELERLVDTETKSTLTLKNGIIFEVLTASINAPRSRAYALALIEEAAFLPTEENANPDQELVIAVGPALGRVKGSVMMVLSSPYKQKGILWEAKVKHGDPGTRSPKVAFIQASTRALNPEFSQEEIDRLYARDPVRAATEYGGEFRTDVSGFVLQSAVDACVQPDRFEVPPIPGVAYMAFFDFSGGSGSDSATMAIGHRTKEGMAILDFLREKEPPFNPSEVCAEFAFNCKRYGISKIVADRFGGGFPAEGMGKHGIKLVPSERDKSQIYLDFLPLVNSGTAELLDHPKLVKQLVALERRTGAGRDRIDHPKGEHDDVVNAVAGVLTLMAAPVPLSLTWGRKGIR